MGEAAPGQPRRGPGRPRVVHTDDEVRDLLQGLADGLWYDAIGRRLNPLRPLNYEAVKSRVHRLKREWRATTIPHLVALAYQRGVLTVDTPRDTVSAPGRAPTAKRQPEADRSRPGPPPPPPPREGP